MVAGTFLPVARWRRAAWTPLTSASRRHYAWSDATAITRTADRLMTLIWSSALSFFWKALLHNPSALTQPPIPVARSPPQVATSAAALRTASDGRHGQGVRADWSAASHSRSRTARRERHATEH